jgi:hypothetical protein
MTAVTTALDWSGTEADNAAHAFCEELIHAGSQVRLPHLLQHPRAGALYHQPGRHGVAVTAVPTHELRRAELAGLLRFRLAQYLQVGFIDRQLVAAQRMRAEPASITASQDVHVVAGQPETGEVLCYMVMEQPPPAGDGTRLRASDRALFPVERVHGRGVYNRLPILPDLPVAKIRELGRFVKNQRPTVPRDQVSRAVLEVGVAMFRLVAGPIRLYVDAVIGDLEEHVAKVHLDFFHVPSVVVHGTVPYQPSASYLYPRYLRHTVYPFATLTSDITAALPRLQAIENALAKPGRLGLLALLRLRATGGTPPVSMLHAPGAAPLGDLRLPQTQVTMHGRSRLIQQGERLRCAEPFAALSVAEATMLATQMDRVSVTAGRPVVRFGECADALYVIEQGYAEILAGPAGPPIGSAGPGQMCGHVAMLTGTEHRITVIATTDMTVLRLAKPAYDRYLAGLPDVASRISQDALRLWAALDRCRDGPQGAAAASCHCGPDCRCGTPPTTAPHHRGPGGERP